MENIQSSLVVEEHVSLDAEPTVVETIDEWEEMPAPMKPSQHLPHLKKNIRQFPSKKIVLIWKLNWHGLMPSVSVRTPEAEQPKNDPRLEALQDQLSELDF